MGVDYLAFFQDRISNAYEEQIWAVTLITGMNAFISSQAKPLLEAFKYRSIAITVFFTSSLAIVFVWSRHIIFIHYDSLAKTVLADSINNSIKLAETIPKYLGLLSQLSGVVFYTAVIIGMTIIAIKRLRAQHNQMIDR